ncbi:MAG TPA: hypothetical protein DCS21_12800 [Gammaproteobacteria bacterium]|nr:hypothetical protein [Gammaproteobacteria bacterium]
MFKHSLLILAVSAGGAVCAPALATEPAAPPATTEPSGPTREQPVWNAPDHVYSRFLVKGGAFHVLADDLTGDGRVDLAFTSHSGNLIQVYRQTAPRRFESMAAQEIVGFHPNDAIALPGAPKRYLINAEGDNQLRVVKANADGRLELVANYPHQQPLGTTPFAWPEWGRLSLAVTPYTGSSITLLRDFDPEKGKAKATITIPTDNDPRPARLADLKGDGIPELVFPTFWSNKVWAIEFAGADQTPIKRELAAFKEGWPRHVVPMDVNRDGKIDLLTPMSVQEQIAVLLNDGQGQFTQSAPITYPGRVGVHTLAVGEDRGGRYLLAGGSHALVLYRERQEATGQFDHRLLPILNWPNRVKLIDVDGDKWLDAVVANQGQLESQVIYGPLWDIFDKLAASPPGLLPPQLP